MPFMKKLFLSIIALALLLTSCANEFNAVYKSADNAYKYEYAKECFARGKYTRATTLLSTLVTLEKARKNGEDSLYMLGMSQYMGRDYESAAQTFKRYVQMYPKNTYSDVAQFYIGQSLYMSTPEPRLDQSMTISAISAFQEYLDIYPDAKFKTDAQQRLFDLQDKLVRKELYNAQLYYDLGPYFGNCNAGENNYQACIITAQNALKDYPYTTMREDFARLIMKSKFELAESSVEEKRLERYQDAEDECYGFINEYPDSKDKQLAERLIRRCKQATGEKVTETNESKEEAKEVEKDLKK